MTSDANDMPASTASAESSINPELGRRIPLVRGGPFYRAQEAIRLIDSDRWNLGKRIAIAIAVCWAPLLILTLIQNPSAARGLMGDYPVNVRLLVAIPVLLAGQILMENVFLKVLRHIGDAGLLSVEDMRRLDATVVKLIRLRRSAVPEVSIVVIGYAVVRATLHTRMSIALPWELLGAGASAHLSAAGWYYGVVSQLLYQFLLLVSLWTWILWGIFLFHLSKLDLRLVPTHPDKHGGVGFLGISPIAIAPTVFVAAAAIGATWREEIMRQGMHLIDFKFYAAMLLIAILLVAFGPLVFFVPKLSQLRRRGILQYGILGQIHSTAFHEKWINHRPEYEAELLAAPEISALIDFSGSFENIEKLQPFPFDKGAFFGLIFSVVLPMLPVVLAEIPLVQVLKGLLSAVR